MILSNPPYSCESFRPTEEVTRHPCGYTADTPAAIVYKATWPDQKTFVCTVGTLAKTAADNNITKTALMIIGDSVAAAHYDRSKLYDPGFTTEFREATK